MLQVGGTRRASVGKVTFKEWRRFRVLPRVQLAPSAATTPAAAKTAAAIQEINDENEPGWIFGKVVGSVASVTTDRDGMWDELVLDSGSVSTACPHA